jgi:hypothetical protein
MGLWLRMVGTTYRKVEGLMRPWLYARQKRVVLQRYPQLAPVMAAYERHYIRVQYGAHDLSLMERIQRKIAQDSQYIYGSTPWATFMQIAEHLPLEPDDVFVELGSGTGHLCFFMHQALGVQAIGLEALNTFVTTAKTLVQELSQPPYDLDLKGLSFYNLDFMTFHFPRGSIFYLAGTCFPAELQARIAEKLATTRSGTRVIALTHPLEAPGFELLHEIPATFSWGRDIARIYRKT